MSSSWPIFGHHSIGVAIRPSRVEMECFLESLSIGVMFPDKTPASAAAPAQTVLKQFENSWQAGHVPLPRGKVSHGVACAMVMLEQEIRCEGWRRVFRAIVVTSCFSWNACASGGWKAPSSPKRRRDCDIIPATIRIVGDP